MPKLVRKQPADRQRPLRAVPKVIMLHNVAGLADHLGNIGLDTASPHESIKDHFVADCGGRGHRRLVMARPTTLVAQLHEARRSHRSGYRRQARHRKIRVPKMPLDRQKGSSTKSS